MESSQNGPASVAGTIAWGFLALLVIPLGTTLLTLAASTSLLFLVPTWTMSSSELLLAGWAWVVVWGFLLPTLLLFGTAWARSLSRAMVWVTTAMVALELLSSWTPLIGGRPFSALGSYFAYDFTKASGPTYAAALAIGAACQLAGVAVFVAWRRRVDEGRRSGSVVEQALQTGAPKVDIES